MKTRVTSLLVTTFILSASLSSHAEILMAWKRTPLPIDLHVNQERIIFVDKNVAVGLPPELDKSKIQVQSMGGAVYLKSLAVFDLQRIQLRDVETGQIILLDLRSQNRQEKLDSVRIVNETVENNVNTISQTQMPDPENEQKIESNLPAPAALVRYAAQSLYAPLRTVEPLPGVRRIATKLPKNIPNLMPNLSLSAMPLESWGLDNYVVTAIRLKNQMNYQVNLDPKYLQGYFYSAAFQHHWLGPKGSSEDTTIVYIVTEGSPNHAFIIPRTVKAKSAKN